MENIPPAFSIFKGVITHGFEHEYSEEMKEKSVVVVVIIIIIVFCINNVNCYCIVIQLQQFIYISVTKFHKIYSMIQHIMIDMDMTNVFK